MPRLTKREWVLVNNACSCLWDSLDISNSSIKDRLPDVYKQNEKDMKTLEKIIAKISGAKRQ